MRRNVIQELRKWKARADRKPLILLGARQVGKTWLMKEFGKTDYQSVAYVNCDENPMAKQMFEPDYDISRILLTVQALTGVKVEPGATLLILDELQETPRGLHCLKYFYENAPEYHVVAAGSLLGLSLNSQQSFPVGKVDMLRLYPMDFSEFLQAVAGDELFDTLKVADYKTLDVLAPKLTSWLRQYYFVGGMPEVVASFVEKQDLDEVRRKQGAILDAYRKDISKHATKNEAVRIGQVLDSLPSQLAKENRKFVYGVIRNGARATEYELAIQWLIDAGLVHKVSRVSELRMPLKFYEDRSIFKLFMLDCGLLSCMSGASAAQMLVDENAFVEFKGAFTEQFVLQQLVAKNIVPYYWSNQKTPAEIDFIVETSERVVPIEVKAEKNVRARSLSTYIAAHQELALKGLRLSMLPYVDQGWMENVPLYSLFKLF